MDKKKERGGGTLLIGSQVWFAHRTLKCKNANMHLPKVVHHMLKIHFKQWVENDPNMLLQTEINFFSSTLSASPLQHDMTINTYTLSINHSIATGPQPWQKLISIHLSSHPRVCPAIQSLTMAAAWIRIKASFSPSSSITTIYFSLPVVHTPQLLVYFERRAQHSWLKAGPTTTAN